MLQQTTKFNPHKLKKLRQHLDRTWSYMTNIPSSSYMSICQKYCQIPSITCIIIIHSLYGWLESDEETKLQKELTTNI